MAANPVARAPVGAPTLTEARGHGVGDRSLSASTFRSLVDLWNHRVGSTPEGECLTWKGTSGWTSLTWREADRRVQRIAQALVAAGIEPGDRVGIVGSTRVEWILADLGILTAGCATTTAHPSSPPGDLAYVFAHSGARVVFANGDQIPKLRAVRERLPKVERVVCFDADARGSEGPGGDDGWVVDLEAFESSAPSDPSVLAARVAAIEPGSLATLIYTSGTTGVPKGVMLSHDAWVYEAEALDALGVMSPADRQLLFLPLAHVFAKVLQVAFIRLGIPTVVVDARRARADGRPSDTDLLEALEVQQPTWMGGVPRVFEKSYARIVRDAEAAGPARLRVFRWALGVGREVSQLRQQGREPSGLLHIKARLADRLVFSKVKARFGGRLRFFISGGAPLPVEIAEFFHACDVLILEGYGLTESAAASCVNPPYAYRFGTVGPPLPGCAVRIAEDGEILLKSRGVMQGYWNDPEGTAEALTADGWLRTGDIGFLHDSGHLQITDRKKDILVTAGGKNIAPAHVQNLLKARCPLVADVVVHGDRRPFCSALIALDMESTVRWLGSRPSGAPSDVSPAALARLPAVRDAVQACVDEVNKEVPSYEAVRRFAILPEEPSEDNGLLTPSLKVKRAVVESRYQAILDGFYREPLEEVRG